LTLPLINMLTLPVVPSENDNRNADEGGTVSAAAAVETAEAVGTSSNVGEGVDSLTIGLIVGGVVLFLIGVVVVALTVRRARSKRAPTPTQGFSPISRTDTAMTDASSVRPVDGSSIRESEMYGSLTLSRQSPANPPVSTYAPAASVVSPYQTLSTLSRESSTLPSTFDSPSVYETLNRTSSQPYDAGRVSVQSYY
jgi:hypothetical protein